ncbi:hypothetical protein KC19_8G113600 [Ceratodon purpureus]|uniref:Uncharacterized protein n=1 Tax=Ceratodon purpureus TaxID=3225 RepID=A0A8T0H285_CERPU|nr:hypothetical protein KC19_8G113600 [Ceratodon purpureus]
MVAAAMRNSMLEKCCRQPHIMPGRLQSKGRKSLIPVRGCYLLLPRISYVSLSNPDVTCEAEVKTKVFTVQGLSCCSSCPETAVSFTAAKDE